MADFSDTAAAFVSQYWSVLLGGLVVAAYARERFNEPTFPSGDTLPHTVAPLRYLFLGSAYEKARRTYVIASLLLYVALLMPGQNIAALGIDPKSFPPQAWALTVALLLVGLLPTAKIKWISMVEEWLRRSVHELFLVPAGVARTIGMLEDAPYSPPQSQLEGVREPQRGQIEAGLRQPRGSLQYRFARATMLIAALNQMGSGMDHPLQLSAFAPFEEDFKAIRERYRGLAQDVAAAGEPIAPDKEDALRESARELLRRIYAYVSWGVRQQAPSEGVIVETLKALGFTITVLEGRRMFDIVAPAAGAVALVALVFWLGYDTLVSGHLIRDTHAAVLADLTSATAAAIMYGFAVSLALKHRAVLIEESIWRAGSPRCLSAIAWRAGLISWAVIVASTFLGRHSAVLQSLAAWLRWDEAATISGPHGEMAAMNFVPVKIATALPWVLAGAAASAMLAWRVGGDVRRTDLHARLRDAAWIGTALALAVLLAQLVQSTIGEELQDVDSVPLKLMPMLTIGLVGLIGLICGAILGFMVPYACRANVVTPPDLTMVRMLKELISRAEMSLGSATEAANFVFSPHIALRGITPAEAIQYGGYKSRVRQLLDEERAGRTEQDRVVAIVPRLQA
jgi:hypothetical protein